MLPAAPDDGNEVAVAATVRAEGQVHVEVSDDQGIAWRFLERRNLFAAERPRNHFLPSFRLSTARKASCGTSTAPTCFIRFFPAFCFSSSFRLREMSPP